GQIFVGVGDPAPGGLAASLLALLEQLFREGNPEQRFSLAGLTVNDPVVDEFSFGPENFNLSLAGTPGPSGPVNVAGLSDAELGEIAPAAGPGAGGGQNQQSQCGNSFLSSGFSEGYNMATCNVSFE